MASATSPPPAVTDLVVQIVEQFRPERTILFGSHANGTADDGSNVDLLVVADTRQPPPRQAVAIYLAIPHDVPVDILVRTPDQVAARNPRDLILRTILAEGTTVYEAGT